MKKTIKFIIMFLIVVLFSFNVYAGCTATVGSAISTTYDIKGVIKAVSVPIALVCDGSPTAITDDALEISPSYRGMELRSVEVEYGTSTNSVLIENSRATKQWYLSALDATENKMYGGHTSWGIYPVFNDTWSLTIGGTMDASDSVNLILNFRAGD